VELRHLRYFAAVAELRNVTLAARRLHVAQPALSRQIQDLEEELGMKLLERSTRGIRLTEAGKFSADEAVAVLARAEQALKAVRALARGETGELRVGTRLRRPGKFSHARWRHFRKLRQACA
jgi:DNA-binding transcriptional LysR family regulator